MECLQNCWAQNYTQRPTAKRIEESFKACNLMMFKNSYEIKDTTVCAALVTKADSGNEKIWIAITGDHDRTNYLESYAFLPQSHVVITNPRNKYGRYKLCKMVRN